MISDELSEKLGKAPLIGDGAMGSELMKKGLEPGKPTLLWNQEHPEKVSEVHKSYLEAGSRFLLANTFGGNRLKLAASDMGDRMEELNRAGVRILSNLRDTTEEDFIIVGDIGPTGGFLEPVGEYSFEDFKQVFAAQAEVLADSGADILMAETMTDLNEAIAAVEGIRSVSNIPVVASMTFEKASNGEYASIMGIRIEEFVNECEQREVEVIGTNCGNGIDESFEAIEKIESLTDSHTIVFPNAGAPRVEKGKTVYDDSPDVMKPYFKKMIDLGANIIGGCCGTTPEHIRMLASLKE